MNKIYLKTIFFAFLIHFITSSYVCGGDKDKDKVKVADYAVSITTVKDTVTECGGFLWRVKFNTKDKSQNGGWLVQEINFTRIVDSCGHHSDTLHNHFWEAWEIKKDKDYPNTRDLYHIDFDDQYSEPDAGKTRGSDITVGKIKYFDGVTLPASMRQNNPNTVAGILHSDTTAPPFFNTNNATNHNYDLRWNCCDTPHSRTVQRDPVRGIVGQSSIPEKRPMDSLGNLIQSIPAWTEGYDKEKEQKFINIAKQVSRNSPEKIKNSLGVFYNNYCNDNNSIDQLSKAYILLRAIFNVPSTIDKDQVKVFGGWIHPSIMQSTDKFDLMWPLSLKNNHISVTGKYLGYYGSTYDVLGEFDYFKEKYQVREIQ